MYIYRGKFTFSVKFQDEAITIIFPSTLAPDAQVLLLSQLTVTSDDTADKFFLARGVIKSSDAPNTIAFSLAHSSGSIDFLATRSDDHKELQLRLGQNILTKHLTTLSLVYHVPGASNPKVYGGTLNLEVTLGGNHYSAAKETLVAISTQDPLGEERFMCVFWQWTEVHVTNKSNKVSTTRKVNVHFVSPSHDSSTLALVDGGFTFSLRRGENHQTPHTLVIENMDIQAQSLVTLELLFSFIQVFITNDTSEFVNCRATSSSSASETAYAKGGILFAALGIPMVFAPPHIGLPFACGALVYSYAAFGWKTENPDKGVYDGMPPDGMFEFRDSGDVTITILRVKQVEKTILVQLATIEKVPGGYFKISSVDEKSWVDIVRLDSLVPDKKVLKTRGMLRLEGVKPTASNVGKVIDDTNSSVDMGIYYLDPSLAGQVRYQQSFASKDPPGGPLILERNTGSYIDILFTRPAGDSWSINQVGISRGDLMLVLRYVDIIWPDTVTEDKVLTVVGGISKQFIPSIQMAIDNDGWTRRQVYYVKNNGKQLYGVRNDYTNSLQFKILPRDDPNYQNVYTILRFGRHAMLNAVLVEKEGGLSM